MRLIVGLGNPGKKYLHTRHNIGFMAVDKIASKYTDGRWKKQFQGVTIKGNTSGKKFILLKPQTYMNLSGQSVGEAMRYYQLTPAHIVVFHDEIDLLPKKVKIKVGGGNAGHNGLKSITQHIGAEFMRIRLGVGRPSDKSHVHNYVLGNFSKDDRDGWLSNILDGVSDGLPSLLDHNIADFLNLVNHNLTIDAFGKVTKKVADTTQSPAQEAKPSMNVFAKLSRLFKNEH